ncbi:MAG: hypothetical protein R3C59_15550 [Planctomycetaceae bacterium]
MKGIPVLLMVMITAGCRSDAQHVAVENQLRAQEADLRRLRSKVTETEQLLADQDQELQALRQNRGERPASVFSEAGQTTVVSAAAEVQVAWGSVTSLRIHELTSGLTPAVDDAEREMNVVLQPLDEDSELVKVAGDLEVHVSAVQDNGQTVELASRSYSITDSRRLWTRGLVSSGFHVQLPIPAADIQKIASDGQILVAATLRLGPERSFSTSTLLSAK